jgi:nitrogen fixation protein NifB
MEEIKNEQPVCRVAVATYEGVLVNQHLGMAEYLAVYEINKDGFCFVGRRRMPARGGGDARWEALANMLSDCRALLAAGIGQRPVEVLTDKGLNIYEVEGLIEDALAAIYEGKELRMPHRTVKYCRRASSDNAGQGCG